MKKVTLFKNTWDYMTVDSLLTNVEDMPHEQVTKDEYLKGIESDNSSFEILTEFEVEVQDDWYLRDLDWKDPELIELYDKAKVENTIINEYYFKKLDATIKLKDNYTIVMCYNDMPMDDAGSFEDSTAKYIDYIQQAYIINSVSNYYKAFNSHPQVGMVFYITQEGEFYKSDTFVVAKISLEQSGIKIYLDLK